MTTLWRIFISSWKHILRNAWIGLATVMVFAIALLSVNVVLGAQAMLNRVVYLLEQKVDVTISFRSETPTAVLDQARFYLVALPQISDVRFLSADDVLHAFRERHASQPSILSGLDELGKNPLGAQLVIKAHNSDDYPFLLQAVKNPQYLSFIQSQTYNDHQSAIARVRDISARARLIGAVLVALFALFGLLAAFNAIRVAIYTQREEIGIMRLVGASTGFIRGPFILEGMWLALLSVMLCVGAVYGVLHWIEPMLRPLFDGSDTGLTTFFFGNATLLIAIEGGGLVLLAALVSWAAVGRYIHR